MKIFFYTLAIVSVLTLPTKARADCPETAPVKHCSSVSAQSGVDWVDTQNGRPLAGRPKIEVKSRSGPFGETPQLIDAIRGKVRFGVSWRIGIFSCIEYTVHYCSN